MCGKDSFEGDKDDDVHYTYTEAQKVQEIPPAPAVSASCMYMRRSVFLETYFVLLVGDFSTSLLL